MPVASLVERARSLQRSFTGLKIEIVDQVVTPDRIAVAFYMRGRHVGPLLTLKGANIGVTSSSAEGWEDRRHGLLLPLSRSAGLARCAGFVAAAGCI
jgi:hypothetical protein